jgi:hypothetical protein
VSPPATTSRAGPFSGVAVLWMVTVGVLSALLFLVLTAYAPQLRNESNGDAHAMSKSAIGFAGLVKLLGDEGVPVVLSRNPRPGPESHGGLLILTPGLETDPKVISRLGGATVELIVLPKWIAAPDQDHSGWVTKVGLLPTAVITSQLLHAFDGGDHLERRTGRAPVLLRPDSGFSSSAPVPTGQIEDLQSIAGPDHGWVSVINLDQDHAILIKQRDKDLFILSDPDLLNNQGLAQLANARGASALISGLRGGDMVPGAGAIPVAFDLTLAGFTRSRSLLGLAFEPPFLAATLCAIAAAGLMGVHAAARFGPPLRPERTFAMGKRALADNSAALIRLVGREHLMGAGYAVLTRWIAAHAVGAPRDLDDDQMDALLDRLGQAKGAGTAFSELERRARDARDAPAMMNAAQALFRWRLEMTHERR